MLQLTHPLCLFSNGNDFVIWLLFIGRDSSVSDHTAGGIKPHQVCDI
jgi:hypothetical protein